MFTCCSRWISSSYENKVQERIDVNLKRRRFPTVDVIGCLAKNALKLGICSLSVLYVVTLGLGYYHYIFIVLVTARTKRQSPLCYLTQTFVLPTPKTKPKLRTCNWSRIRQNHSNKNGLWKVQYVNKINVTKLTENIEGERGKYVKKITNAESETSTCQESSSKWQNTVQGPTLILTAKTIWREVNRFWEIRGHDDRL